MNIFVKTGVVLFVSFYVYLSKLKLFDICLLLYRYQEHSSLLIRSIIIIHLFYVQLSLFIFFLKFNPLIFVQ